MARVRDEFGPPDRGRPKILTSCPSCLQGLKRLRETSGVEAEYIVVELARTLKGEDWQQRFIREVRRRGIEYVLM